MKKIGNTNVKTFNKISEFESADTVQIVEDILDFNRGQSVANGVVIGRQKGSRRIIDNARNSIAHETVDYSNFKVTRIETGVTVDNSKKEQKIEEEALKLLADLGIDWTDDEEETEEVANSETEEETEEEETEPAELDSLLSEIIETEEVETEETDSDRIEEEDNDIEEEEMPDDFDSLIASIVGTDDDNDDDDDDSDDDDWGDDEEEMPEQFESLIDELMATC